MQNSALQVTNLCFSYGENVVFENLALECRSGEICAILAPNGVGKTTLFKILLGLLKCKAQIMLNTKDDSINLNSLSAHKRAKFISYMPQFIDIAFAYSALDVVLLGAESSLFSTPDSVMRTKALNLLKEFGLESFANKPITHLSGGQRQLVFLAQNLMQESQILLLDEPSAHLDMKNKILLFEKIKAQTAQKNLITIINLHDIDLISRYAHKIYMIKNHTIYKSGKTSEILTSKNLKDFFELSEYTQFSLSQM